MSEPEDQDVGTNTVKAEDVEVRDVGRRSFLKEVGLMAGIAGMAGFVAGCGSDSADNDAGDPADADPTDPADSDRGDPADSD